MSVGKYRLPRRSVRRALPRRLERADQGRARSALDHDADLDRRRRRRACRAAFLCHAGAAASWPWLVASSVIHLFYFAGLIEAYRTGDLGQVYPIARGSAPLMTATATTIFVGERLSLAGWGGIVALAAGVLLLSMRGGRDLARLDRRAVGFALFTALTICAYSVVDGIGARLSGATRRLFAVAVHRHRAGPGALCAVRATGATYSANAALLAARAWRRRLAGRRPTASRYGR